MHSQQFIGVQILRFVAAMLVVVMHTDEAISLRIGAAGPDDYWTGGSAGVDIFFVISGFVMALSAARPAWPGQSRLGAAWVFLQRRLLRIVPLYWFYTLLKAALIVVLPDLALRSSLDFVHLAASLLFIPVTSPWGLTQPVLPVGWTLNDEMLFYLLFAAAIAWGLPRIGFCLLAFGLIFLGRHFFPEAVALAFYGQSLVFEFVLGMGIAHLWLNYPAMHPAAGLLATVAGAAWMFGIHWSDSSDRFCSWGIGAALMVLGAVWLEPWTARLPLAWPLPFLGDTSYSLYLSHTFVVPANVLLLGQLDIQSPLPIMLLTGLTAVALGCLSYLWLERPLTGFVKRTLFRMPKLSF